MNIDRFARKSGIGYQGFGWLGLLVLLVVALLVVLPASAAVGQPVKSGVVTWTGKGGDERWSNPANWDSGRVPGPTDKARFTVLSSNAHIDPRFGNLISGLMIETGYHGTLQLDRPLRITGDLAIQDGTFDAGSANLFVNGAVKVGGGLFITPRAVMEASSLDIAAPGVVRMGLNGSLNLSGSGAPLTGKGLLDVLTNRPNVVQYTGRSTISLSAAGPATQLRATTVDKKPVQQRIAAAAASISMSGPKAPEFSPASSITFTSTDQSSLAAAVVDTTNHFAYFGTNTAPNAFVVKVDLSPTNFHEVGFVSLPSNVALITSGAIDMTHNYAYFGAEDTSFLGGRVVKVNVAPAGFAFVGTLNLPNVSGNEDTLTSAVADPALDAVYFGTSNFVAGTVIKVGFNGSGTPVYSGTITLPLGEDLLGSAVIDTTNHVAYFGVTDVNTVGNGHVVKVALSPTLTRIAGLTLTGITYLNAGVIDAANGFAYFAASAATLGSGIPADVIKIQLSTLTQVGSAIQPFTPDHDLVGAGVIDVASGNLYFGASDAAGLTGSQIGKVQLSTFTTAQVITLTAAETPVGSGVIDPANHYAYFGMNTTPGIVSRILLDNSQTTVSASSNPSVFGQTVTFTSTVTNLGAGSAPTGTVTFLVDGSTVATRTLTVVGSITSTATYTNSTLSVGTHTIASNYAGNTSFTPSSGSLNQTVNKANTTTGLVSSINPAVFGQPITLTATVTATLPGAGTPSGVITFTFDSTTNVTATLNASRVATYVTSTLSVAAHPITATYGGSTNFNVSSGAISQVINRASTTTGLTTSASPTVYGQPITLTATVTATAPGVGTPTGIVTFTFDGTTNVTANLNASRVATYVTSTLAVATHPIVASYAGDTNFTGSSSGTVSQVVNKANTTTSVTSAPNPSVFGQSVTFTATVVTIAPGAGNPSGTVTFFDGATNIGTGTVGAGGIATLSTSALTVSVHSNITAQYGGDASFNASTSNAYSHTVNKVSTTTSVTSAPNPSVFGQSVTFTATVVAVAPGSGNPSGTVTFFDGATNIGTGTVGAGGIATFSTSALTVSVHSNITAQYGGDASFNASTSSAYSHTVNKANATTGVTATPNPSVFGQSVTFTAIVTATAPGAGTPTGTITFTFDGSTSVVATLNASRVATYVTSTLATAVHPVSATYSGDGNFNTSSAALPTQTVNKAGTTTNVTSSVNSSIFGQSVTFTATVAAVAPGVGNPSGTVTFTIDAATTNVALINGVATLTTSSLAVGPHAVSATYSGDSNFNTSSGTLPTQTVNKASTTTNVTSSVNPSIFGQSVTFTATVAAVLPGVGTPTGIVTFTIDGTPTAVASSGGVATLSTSSLTIGSHTVSAAYGGDGSFNGSSATLPTQVVNKTSTTTSLTSASNPSVFGQSVTFTATVTVVAPGAGNPSGTVTFFDGATNIGSGIVGAGGNALLSLSTLSVGTHSNITAQYGGDTNFNGSTSSAYSHTVNKANTTTGIVVTSPALFGQTWPITVSVAPVAPGSGTPGGTVNVTDGTVSCNVTLPATSCSLTFNVLGSHTLTATYSGDANFNTSNTTSPLNVVDVPITGLSAVNSSPTRLDNTTFFSASQTTGTNIIYAWNFGDGSLIGSGVNVAHTYALSGTFTAIVTATNSLSSQSAATPVTITNQRPVAVAFDTSFSLNSVATLDGSLSTDPDNHYPLTYYWTQTGGGAVSFTPNLSVTTFTAPSAPTVLTFTLIVTDAHGLPSLPKTVSITIADIPISGLAASNSSPTAIGVPTQLTATVTSGSSVNYTWNFGDGITTTGQFVAHTYGALGNYAAIVTATNSLGTFSTSTSVSIIKATPAIAITAHTPDPSVVGQSVTINFSVTPPGVGTPTGTVTVTAGAQNCSASVATGFCTIAFTTPGTKSLTAQYSGDTNFNTAVSASVNHTVNAANTTTSVSSTSNPSVFGQSVTFTATVAVAAPGSGTPTGSVTFTIDGVPVGTVAVSGGVAAFTTSSLSVATHPVVATYGGDANFNGSASTTLNQVVNKANTLTSVASSANPSVFGQSVTFTVTIAASAPGVGTPSGTVTITIDGTPTAIVLSGGVATLTTSSLTVGSHTVSAVYSGDGNFNASSGAMPTQTVNKANSATTVVSSQNPSIISQTVTFTATVTASAPGAGNPSGTVTFTIDGVPVATTVLSGGSATYSTSTLAVGSHPVSATYSGDGNFNTSIGGLTQVVNRPPSATSVTSAPNPSVFGQSVTFTATVVPVSGGPTPSGLVTFTIDGATAGSVALSGGVASFNIATLSVSGHPVVVSYGGDANFNSSASSTYTQTVNKASTTTSVTSAPNPTVFGQSATFTATVTVSAPGAGIPSGTVTFFDGATNIGTGPVNVTGIATLSISTLSVGAHNAITAQYGGDASFNGSTSGSYLHTVSAANTTTILTSAPNPSVFGQSVTFTATVAVVVPGAGNPSGMVTITIDGVPVGTATLSGGVATYVTSTLAAGSHSVIATYGGDNHFNGSAANAINQVVNKANTATTVISSLNPAPVTRLITFTATIAAVAPGVGTPTGVVTFTIDGVTVGVPALSGGVAIYSTSMLTAGTHTVSAAYGGAANYNGSAGVLTPSQIVNKYRIFLPIVHR